ncbi:hypothetical protein DCAR_0727247 [Daucus carota subsp. sativus]|uniref:cytochrome-b5 reductase n=1 Tax=Daucus carota subsp. sativus TaxID=79200 RepID=A0AAF0XH16_DAUCS|nr:hypothetical protein DCAR_0727247 [Daucus carota subsp. sativus]
MLPLLLSHAIVFLSNKSKELSHNVAEFKFALSTPSSVLGLPIGQHNSCSQGGEVIKPYTPTTLGLDVGHFKFVIKLYPQGRMSQHFHEMRVGDYMAVKGPKPFQVHPDQVRAFGMLAAGSGITPMIQSRPLQNSKLNLIKKNYSLEVRRCNKEIDGLTLNYPDRFKILRCKPPPMNKAMAASLKALGYSPERRKCNFSFNFVLRTCMPSSHIHLLFNLQCPSC